MNPADEIRLAQQNIISLEDVLEHLIKKYGMTDKEAASYLMRRLFPNRLKSLEKNLYPANPSYYGKRVGLTDIVNDSYEDHNLFKMLDDIINNRCDDFPF